MDLGGLNRGTTSSYMAFNKAKFWVLQFHHDNPVQQYRLAEEWLEGRLAEKTRRSWAIHSMGVVVCPGGSED